MALSSKTAMRSAVGTSAAPVRPAVASRGALQVRAGPPPSLRPQHCSQPSPAGAAGASSGTLPCWG